MHREPRWSHVYRQEWGAGVAVHVKSRSASCRQRRIRQTHHRPHQRRVQLPQKVAIRDFRYSQFPGRSQFDEIFTSLPLDCWDQSQALDVGGDDKFLMELAAISSAACPAQLKSLEDSIAPKNLSFLAPAFYGERGGRSTHSRGRRSFDGLAISRETYDNFRGSIPIFFIRVSKVVRLRPMRAAAPLGPPTRPLVSFSIRTILSCSSKLLVLT